VGTVVVEASPWLEDNQWVLDLAKESPGIVGFVGNLAVGRAGFAGSICGGFDGIGSFEGCELGRRALAGGVGRVRFLDDLRRTGRGGVGARCAGGSGRAWGGGAGGAGDTVVADHRSTICRLWRSMRIGGAGAGGLGRWRRDRTSTPKSRTSIRQREGKVVTEPGGVSAAARSALGALWWKAAGLWQQLAGEQPGLEL
jgi:hypothetical protein